MRRYMIAVSLLLAAQPVAAQDNVVVNGEFTDGLSGWTTSRAGTVAELDTDEYHSAPASLRMTATEVRIGVTTPDHQFEAPLPTALSVSGWLRATEVSATARIGLDLKIVLDDGSTTWFFPNSLTLAQGETERWVEKLAGYLAPPGRRIAAIAVFCLAYEAPGATAWYDDVQVRPQVVATPTDDVAVLYARSADEPASRAVSEALTAAGIEHDLVPAAVDLAAVKLVIRPAWTEDETVYFRLKVHHYLGGRLLLCDLPASKWARAMSRYMWDTQPEELPDDTLVSEDGRAAHVRLADVGAGELAALVRELLATDLELPEAIPAGDFGPKEPYALRDGALFVGDEPLLFRAMGTYRVDGSKPVELHRANFAHLRELRLNGLAVYLSYATPPEYFAQVLDAAWAEGLRVMVWVYGPPASPYTEKPLKDDWVLRFLPLCSHPAMLAWIMCDDTFHRYYPFVSRTAEVLRRYDDQNLVTTTIMDLRNPDNVPPEGWEQWKRALDFPLTYLYPLQKGRTFGGRADIVGGLEDVQLLSENARRIWGEPVYVQQWSQAHMQGHATRKLGLTGRTLFVPTCAQQRLLTYMMLTSGTRGIIYFSSYGLSDERLGMGRRAELGLLWGELEPVQDILAAGTITPCETSVPTVEAAAFTRGEETVILALNHGEEYNRYVDESAQVDEVIITLPTPLPDDAKYFRLDTGHELAGIDSPTGRYLSLRDVDVTAALLITTGDARLKGARGHRGRWSGLAARLALTAAADTQAKTQVVADRIGGLMGDDFALTRATGDRLFALAVEQYRAGNPYEAHKVARLAMGHWRAAQATAMRWAEAEHQRQGLGDDSLIWLNIYAALPKFAELHCGGPAYDPPAMRQEVLDALAAHDFLVREP